MSLPKLKSARLSASSDGHVATFTVDQPPADCSDAAADCALLRINAVHYFLQMTTC